MENTADFVVKPFSSEYPRKHLKVPETVFST